MDKKSLFVKGGFWKTRALIKDTDEENDIFVRSRVLQMKNIVYAVSRFT